MKAETWTIVGCGAFFLVVAPVYWLLSEDPTGTVALIMTTLLCALLGFYLSVVAKQIPPRPEDRNNAEIADGAGELGFFPPYSWWPLFVGLSLAIVVVGVVIGWWLFIIGCVLLAGMVIGWVYEYYIGVHAH
ncbi:MAG TPA: cytochrome c oxidase subunit 4 [Aeromicrobium sp.]|nr:cytochrome c oxidase subunit 4 [Aeromicrobium sp.]